MEKIIFIDNGNILRSPIAKALYNQLKKDSSQAFSYGVSVEKQGHQGTKLSSFPELEIEVSGLKEYGLDISDEHCEQLKEEYLINSDKIIVMVEKENIPNWLEKYKYEYWEIPNPETHTSQIIKKIIELIKEKVLKLINETSSNIIH